MNLWNAVLYDGNGDDGVLNLVLVEDDLYTANLIKNTINWHDYNIDNCEVFYDGLSAYEYIASHKADIVITDIKMPGMDGITLIEKCCEISSDMQFIIITGHREFQYAYKAIKFNVFDYLLKPIQLSTLTDILEKVVKATSKTDPFDNMPFQTDNISVDIQSIFSSILNQDADDLKNPANIFSITGIPENMLNSPCVLISLNLIDFDDFITNRWKYSAEQFKNAVTKIIALETDSMIFSACSFLFAEIFILAIAKKKIYDMREIIMKYLEHLKNSFIEIFDLKIKYNPISEFSSIKQILTSVSREQKIIGNNTDIIKKCKAYIYDNLHKQITLSDVAEHVFLNPIYLSSYFKEKTGENFSAYIKNIRIERAKQLLQKDDLSIAQICETIGFKSESYFYKLFKTITGMTPQQYREQHLEKRQE